MTQLTSTNKKWNLFAREVEAILQHRQLSFSALISQLGIHPEKVHRLKESLIKPIFHTLNPDELNALINSFNLTIDEQIRLHAALLATAIEKMLMDRIDPVNALRATEELFPLLLKALRQQANQHSGVAAIRSIVMTDEMTRADLFEQALTQFDSATLALHLSRHVDIPSEKIGQLRKAQEGFAAMITELHILSQRDQMITNDGVWQLWCSEAQHGLTMIQHRLEELGYHSDNIGSS